MKKIIFMSVVITLFAISATSCILGFQSARIQFEATNKNTVESEYIITTDDDRFSMPEIKFTVSADTTKTSDAQVVAWFGFNQEIMDAKFKMKVVENDITTNSNITLKKDINAGLIANHINLDNNNNVKYE